MTERDKIIEDILKLHEEGFAFVRRPDHTVEIYEGSKKIEGEVLDSSSITTGACDPEGYTSAWIMSLMDSPPSHIKPIIRKSNG